ncbi:hypothetical protein [Acidobacterium sp.]|uniref:hypothetical protein n=1 Tax=Acidobacterium sp. TaxID=1872119 RepID=UPI00257F3FF2|nr:hypothetical protein [Acidobacterium sp.]
MEDGDVGSPGNFKTEALLASLSLKIEVQALAELDSIIADDIVVAGIVAGRSPENAHTNILLADFFVPVLQMQLTDVKEKLLQEFRLREDVARCNALREQPARIAGKQDASVASRRQHLQRI